MRKVTRGEEERERKNTVNRGHFVLPKTTKGSAQTSLAPKSSPLKKRKLYDSLTKNCIQFLMRNVTEFLANVLDRG